jgi:hypothetical protein
MLIKMNKNKVVWGMIIIGVMAIPIYIFFSPRWKTNNTFTTSTIGLDVLSKENIEQLCNTTLGENQTVKVFDNTSRNSFGPYDNNSVYCIKSDLPEYDFIVNLKPALTEGMLNFINWYGAIPDVLASECEYLNTGDVIVNGDYCMQAVFEPKTMISCFSGNHTETISGQYLMCWNNISTSHFELGNGYAVNFGGNYENGYEIVGSGHP